MAARAKNRKTHKTTSPPRLISRFQNNFIQMFLGWPCTKIAKMSLQGWTKWLSEWKIGKKNFKQHLLLGQWADFKNNVTHMLLGWPSTKIAKMVPLCWLEWPSELKIEKTFKRPLLQGQWVDFKIISQECSMDDPLPKLLKWFCSAEQNGHQSKKKTKKKKPVKQHLLQGQKADFKTISQKCFLDDPLPNCQSGSAPLNKTTIKTKNRKKTFKQHLLLGQWVDFKTILQKCSLGDPLPKLLKWFCLDEQNGCQS